MEERQENNTQNRETPPPLSPILPNDLSSPVPIPLLSRRVVLTGAAGLVLSLLPADVAAIQPPSPRPTPTPTVPRKTNSPRLMVQLGHTREINNAIFSPNGRFALTASGDHTVRLWDVATGNEIYRFTGHSDHVTTIIFSPNSQMALTAGRDGRIFLWSLTTGSLLWTFQQSMRADNPSAAFSPDGNHIVAVVHPIYVGDAIAQVWDIRNGKEIRRFEVPRKTVRSAIFSPNGKNLLTTGDDHSVRLWNIETGKEIRRYTGHMGTVTHALYSPDGKRLLTASYDGTARLWNAETAKEIRRFQASPTFVAAIAFSSDARRVLMASRNIAYLWNAVTGRLIHRIQAHADVVLSAVFSPDDRQILTAGDNTARLWDSRTGKEIRRLMGHQGIVYSARFSPSGKQVLTASSDTTTRLWDTTTGKEMRRFVGRSSTVNSALFSSDGSQLLTRSSRPAVMMWDERVNDLRTSSGVSSVALWDLTTGKQEHRLLGYADSVTSMTFHPSRKWLLTSSTDGTARLWDTTTDKENKRFTGHTGTVRTAIFSPDGEQILTGGKDGSARLWSVETGKEIRRFQANKESVYIAIFSPSGTEILTVGMDAVARLWSVETGKEIRHFEGYLSEIDAAFFSPNGDFIATTGDGIGILWDTKTGKFFRLLERNDAPFAPFSPDGKQILTTTEFSSTEFTLWDVATGRELRSLLAHTANSQSAIFSPNGESILSASWDNTAHLWNLSGSQSNQRFTGHMSVVTTAIFLPDGKHICTTSADATTRLWDIKTGRELCSLISFLDGTWAVVAPDGRFDCTNLEDIRGLHWIMPDNPLRQLPLEIFMRNYYEPGLLKRLLNGEKLPPLPSLSNLNQVQPRVTLTAVERASDGTAQVTVEVASVTENGQASGVHDLRLFRDGQLVASREGNIGNGRLTFRGIRLPKAIGQKTVTFSAYAFNQDLIKSETDHRSLNLPARGTPIASPIRRAYIVAMGVDASQDSQLTLRYAVQDAEALIAAVAPRLAATKAFMEVQSLLLKAPAGASTMETVTATKADLRAVLTRLAGKPLTREETARLGRIPGAARLTAVTPDDLLILSFSGHGYANDQGAFYLLPYDIGTGNGTMPPERLARCISSDDLSQWLREVDAGEMAFIVDACHSAQAVEGDGTFKPGPMGSRGLGQLAYDKRIRLLAATQAANIAMESQKLGPGHGLLTYALVREGLEQGKADFHPGDGKITLTEWLKYGVQRVPELWERIRQDQGRGVIGEEFTPADAFTIAGQRRDLQRPTLFDFEAFRSGLRRDTLLAFLPR